MGECEEICPICLDGLQENTTLTLHCGHSLHQTCWEEFCERRIQTLHTNFITILLDCWKTEKIFLSHQQMNLEMLRGGLLRCPLCRTYCSQKGQFTRGYIYRAPLIDINTEIDKLPKIQVFWDLEGNMLEEQRNKRFYHPTVRNTQVKELLKYLPSILEETNEGSMICGLIIPMKDRCGYFHALLNENGK